MGFLAWVKCSTLVVAPRTARFWLHSAAFCLVSLYILLRGIFGLGEMQRTITCVQPPTIDTLQTLHGRSPKDGTVLAACNLQKAADGSLDGVLQRLEGTAPLRDLQGITSELFGGTSVVRCSGALPLDVQEALTNFASDLGTRQTQPTLAELVPLAQVLWSFL